MKPLELTETIAVQLRTLIDEAVLNGRINVSTLRRIIVFPNKTFEALQVVFSDEWESYYYPHEDLNVIGEISLSEWLDVTDAAFENRDQLDVSYLEVSEKLMMKYGEDLPLFSFEHIKEPLFRAYLICLREEVIAQVTSAIKKVAVSYTREDFEHVVGFILLHIHASDDSSMVVLGFNDINGAGPFYRSVLVLPQANQTYPYIKFFDSGFHMYYPQGNIFGESDQESSIYTYDVTDLKYVAYSELDKTEIGFRLQEEFTDWKFCEYRTSKAVELQPWSCMVEALMELCKLYPDKLWDKDKLPNPSEDAEGFKLWVQHVVENNLSLAQDQIRMVYGYGQHALISLLEALPESHTDADRVKRSLATLLFAKGDYEGSLALLQEFKRQSDHVKVRMLYNLYYLRRKDDFEDLYVSIEDPSASKDALLVKWLYDIDLLGTQKNQLELLETEVRSFVDAHRGLVMGGRAALVLAKLYVALGEELQAQQCFQEIRFDGDLDTLLFDKEFSQVAYMQDLYTAFLAEAVKKERCTKDFKAKALRVSIQENLICESKPSNECYEIVRRHADHGFAWVWPIDQKTLIGIDNDDKLFIGDLNSAYELKIHDTLAIDTGQTKSFTYYKGMLYAVEKAFGIISYKIEGKRIMAQQGFLKNPKRKAAYSLVAAYEGHLYACNNGFLEIYEIGKED